ncbi:unnamed protein product [Brassica oleracea]|uniref:(rape) hypothetical protein n=1 Tax=Brassica napus TaxID=3708 RepID=A0A816UJA9_BRANA|nr:unnamed protein product [Brassica napus]
MNNTVGRKLLGLAAAAAIAVSSSICCDSPALAESITIAFPVSRAREVTAVQRTLVEAWGLIRETFVDPTFNHQADAAYGKIKAMLSTLGDPFTRIISPKVSAKYFDSFHQCVL